VFTHVDALAITIAVCVIAAVVLVRFLVGR
jgi:hypothetical protein